jgi:Rrf2 family protein
MSGVYISARVDYAIRALVTLAASPEGAPMKADEVATAQGLPTKFAENILGDLRRAGFVSSQRGNSGGYRLARPAKHIVVADIFRALDGPLAEVRGSRPDEVAYEGDSEHLQSVWIAVRAALRMVLESVSIADVVSGKLPRRVARLVDDPDAWAPRVR